MIFLSSRRLDRLWCSASVQLLPKELSPEVKRPKREAEFSPPSCAEFKKEGTYNLTTSSHFMACAGATTNFIFVRSKY